MRYFCCWPAKHADWLFQELRLRLLCCSAKCWRQQARDVPCYPICRGIYSRPCAQPTRITFLLIHRCVVCLALSQTEASPGCCIVCERPESRRKRGTTDRADHNIAYWLAGLSSSSSTSRFFVCGSCYCAVTNSRNGGPHRHETLTPEQRTHLFAVEYFLRTCITAVENLATVADILNH